MIITRQEVKDLLSLNVDNYDTLIDAMIPITQDFIIKYTNNYFEVLTDTIYIQSNTISFVPGTNPSIHDSQNNFIVCGFVDGTHIRVKGSKNNDGIYFVDTVEAGKLTLSNLDELNPESEDRNVLVEITLVKFPRGLKLTTANMINYQIQQQTTKSISSESLGDYSVSYKNTNSYPDNILKELNQYKKLQSVSYNEPRLYNIYTKK